MGIEPLDRQLWVLKRISCGSWFEEFVQIHMSRTDCNGTLLMLSLFLVLLPTAYSQGYRLRRKNSAISVYAYF